MRTRAFIVIAVAALALAGCGDRNLVLKVDMLSYLEESQKAIPVVPEVIPGDIPPGFIIPAFESPVPFLIVRDTTISLIDGLSEETKVESAVLGMGVWVTVASGSGSGQFKLYLSDEDTDPLTTDAAMTLPVTFPGAPTIGETDGVKVAELFTKGKLRMAVRLEGVKIAEGGVTGLVVNLTKLDAIVIAGRKAF